MKMTVRNITMIGSGKVATALATALYSRGLQIDQVYSRNPSHATRLAQSCNARAVSIWQDLNIQQSDLYIISVNDDAIADIAAGMNTEKIVVHTSGKTDLAALTTIGTRVGVFYPFQTFSIDRDVVFENVPFMLEASQAEVLESLGDLAKNLSNKIYHYDSHQRALYHLAAVISNNFVNHLYTLAFDILDKNNLPTMLLHPLMLETVEKAISLQPIHAQTGPAFRGDDRSIAKHLELLQNETLRQKLYRDLSDSIQDFYKNNA